MPFVNYNFVYFNLLIIFKTLILLVGAYRKFHIHEKLFAQKINVKTFINCNCKLIFAKQVYIIKKLIEIYCICKNEVGMQESY